MSRYTTELRFICESEAGYTNSQGFTKLSDILKKAAPKIFDFDFPIFDEAYRLPLEVKILRHYYTREISEETVGLWKLRLQSRLCEIMPYYNKLYESEKIKFEPLDDVNVKREHTTTSNGTTNTNGTFKTDNKATAKSSNNAYEMYSDTPSGGVSGVDDLTYLTNLTKNTSNGNSESTDTKNETKTDTNTSQNTETYTETVTGKQGSTSFSKGLLEYRETFINIDKMIINDLSDLFFGLWE